MEENCVYIKTRDVCSINNECCTFDIHKLEFQFRNESNNEIITPYNDPLCTIKSVTVDGVKRNIIRQYFPGFFIKLTDLNISYERLVTNPVPVCFSYNPLCKLCNTGNSCRYALFDTITNKNNKSEYCCVSA